MVTGKVQIGGYLPWNSAKKCVVIKFKPIRLTEDCTLLRSLAPKGWGANAADERVERRSG
jgi:hypothetical protein